MQTLALFLLSLVVGLGIPSIAVDDDAAPACSMGCQITFAPRNGQSCPAIQATLIYIPGGGHGGQCACDPGCKVNFACDITFQLSFSGVGGICVYNRKVGDAVWGQTNHTVTIQGCGAFGAPVELATSTSCDTGNINCKMILDIYCSLCKGVCP